MSETRIYKGYWWLPSEPEEQIAGTLTIDSRGNVKLELYGCFGPADDYVITGLTNVSAAGERMSIDVTSESNTSIAVSADLHDIALNGADNDAYSVTYTAYGDLYDKITLSGVSYGRLSCLWNDEQIRVSGAKTLLTEVTVSEETVSVSAEANANQTMIIDFVSETGPSEETALCISVTDRVALPQRRQTAVPEYSLPSGSYEEKQILTFTKDEGTLVYYTLL